MTNNEIVKLLRRGMFSNLLLNIAADAIEELENDNHRLRAQLISYENTIKKINENLPDGCSGMLHPIEWENKDETIPKEYMVQGSYESGGCRKISPIGIKLRNKPLEEIECPCCGNKDLRVGDYGDGWNIEYQVVCDTCDWHSPTEQLSDYGEATCPFREWLEAWYLLGKPEDRINEDLTLEFYPEGEYRETMRKELRNL